MQLLQINFLEGSSTVLGAMVYRRNKMARGLSQSHDVNAKRTRFSRDDDCQGAVVAPEDDSNIIDISDLVSRDEAPTDSENEANGVTGSRRIRPANDFPYSLAQWVHYREQVGADSWLALSNWCSTCSRMWLSLLWNLEVCHKWVWGVKLDFRWWWHVYKIEATASNLHWLEPNSTCNSTSCNNFRNLERYLLLFELWHSCCAYQLLSTSKTL